MSKPIITGQFCLPYISNCFVLIKMKVKLMCPGNIYPGARFPGCQFSQVQMPGWKFSHRRQMSTQKDTLVTFFRFVV